MARILRGMEERFADPMHPVLKKKQWNLLMLTKTKERVKLFKN